MWEYFMAGIRVLVLHLLINHSYILAAATSYAIDFLSSWWHYYRDVVDSFDFKLSIIIATIIDKNKWCETFMFSNSKLWSDR